MKISRLKWRKYGSFPVMAVLASTIVLSMVLAAPCLAAGLWGPDGILVSNAHDFQEAPAITSDGAGGSIVVWEDYREGDYGNIYAQRYNALGAPLWTANGVRISSIESNQYYPSITTDGAGGAIVAWEDYRNGIWEIYSQRINAGGSCLWSSAGVPINTSGAAWDTTIASDNSGGALIGWLEDRDTDDNEELYAQRVNGGGNTLWAANGVPVNTSGGDTDYPHVICNSDNNAVFAWIDDRNVDDDVYAQTLNAANGNPLWAVNGVPVCNVESSQYSPNLVAGASGNTIFTWFDYRSMDNDKVYVQMLNRQGVAQWVNGTSAAIPAADGIPVSDTKGDQIYPNLTTDGSGGTIVAWLDHRSNPQTVYAQKFGADGNPQWTKNGVQVCTSYAGYMFDLGVVPDGSGGALISWNTLKYYYYYAKQPRETSGSRLQKINELFESETRVQKLLSTGRICPGWTSKGLSVTEEAKIFWAYEVMTSDSAGGAIFAWEQYDDSMDQTDIYVQRMATPNSAWYLAEGSQSWGFDTYITVENPNPTEVTARLTFMTPEGAAAPKDVVLPANSQTTVSPRWVLDWPTDFSTTVECLEGLPIGVDRTMWWTGIDAPSPEAHNSIGVNSPATTWYLPEGSSDWGFETWLLIQNPNNTDATCTVTYMIEGANPVKVDKTVPANSRRSYNMAEDIGAKDASIMVSSNLPVIPERSMYRNSRREGHESIGTTQASTDYFLAEGTTAWGFTTYVLVQNPNSNPCMVNMSFMTSTGSATMEPFSMAPYSRKTVRLNDVVPNTDVSTQVHADLPIIAERSMYWGEGTPLGEATHDSIGTASSSRAVLLPDGQSSDGRETWTLVQNPNDVPVDIKVTYLSPDGTGNQTLTETLPAFTRKTFSLQDKVPSGRAAILVECLTAGKQINAERAMYWNNRGVGTCSIGSHNN